MDGLTLITDLAHEAGNLRQNDARLYLELYPLLLIVTAGWAIQALSGLMKNHYSRSGMVSCLIHELTHALQFLPKGDQRTFGMVDIKGIEATGSYDVSE
jgi:hypothetical protein